MTRIIGRQSSKMGFGDLLDQTPSSHIQPLPLYAETHTRLAVLSFPG